jgi:hypothetical protein
VWSTLSILLSPSPYSVLPFSLGTYWFVEL